MRRAAAGRSPGNRGTRPPRSLAWYGGNSSRGPSMPSTKSLGWPQKSRRSERRKVRGSQMSFFGRVLTAMVTPFDEAANVDYPQAAALAKRLADSGSDGIVVAGTNAESPTLTHVEKNA